MKNQKGISTLVGVIIIIATAIILFGGVFAYEYFATKSQPVVPTDQTADWKTYINKDYGFEVKYPSDWKITDTSSVVAINNTKNTAVYIESPMRYDLPGYQEIPVNYRILIYLDSSSKIVSIADFGSPNLSKQSGWNMDISDDVRKATTEYSIGQQIISTFKFTE